MDSMRSDNETNGGFDKGEFTSLADRYHEFMAFRKEGLARYGSRLYYQIYGPRPRISFPVVTCRKPDFQSIRVGPLFIGDRPPVVHFIDAILSLPSRPRTIVEIGPGRGDLCEYVLLKRGNDVKAYYGVERDPNVRGAYVRVNSLDEIPDDVDVAIASEVAEHMTADNFVSEYLAPLSDRMRLESTLLVTVPNPIVAGGIARDYSHVQSWPWYDMYAVLRLFFGDVEVRRTHYIADPKRLAMLPLRFIIAHAQETDWCEGLVFTARRPLAARFSVDEER